MNRKQLVRVLEVSLGIEQHAADPRPVHIARTREALSRLRGPKDHIAYDLRRWREAIAAMEEAP